MNCTPIIPANLTLVTGTEQAPRFEHDCDCCQFLGHFRGEHGPVDLYVHTRGHMPTVIARFGSDGNYASGMCFAYGQLDDLTEARVRAQKLGILEYNVYEALRHVSANCDDSPTELQNALPFTAEYQAVLAFEAGDTERYQGLVTHLVQKALAYERKHRPDAIEGVGITRAHERIGSVIAYYRKLDPLEAIRAIEGITAFAWGNRTPASVLTATSA